MEWTRAESAWTALELPAGYRIEQLGTNDVQPLTARLRAWYPDIVVGMESPHLDPEFYAEHTSLRGAPERPLLPLVLKHQQDGIVGAVTYEKNPLSRAVFGRLGALAPEHRGALGLLGPLLLERVGRALGAELVHYYATLKTRHQQVIAERAGFALVGIMPAHDRDMVSPGNPKRVYEALYAKVLVDPEQVLLPDREALSRRTRKVFETLFGDEPTG